MGLLVAILPMKKVTNVSHSFLLAKTANNKDAKPRTGLVLCNVRIFMKQCRPDANLHSDIKPHINVWKVSQILKEKIFNPNWHDLKSYTKA